MPGSSGTCVTFLYRKPASKIGKYLNITAIQIRYVQVQVEFYTFHFSCLLDFVEPLLLGLKLLQHIVVHKDLIPKNFTTLAPSHRVA